METNDPGKGVSPEEARELLNLAKGEESATKNPQLSWWFFIVQAVALAMIFIAQVFPAPFSSGVAILGILVALILGIRNVFYRRGYGVVGLDGDAAFPYLLIMLVLAGIPAVLAIGFEEWWLWLVAGVLAGLVTLEMGRRYRKATGNA
ncbi:hypothetical protein [Psychromicrobium lacuslunae]|uniref:Uncharacterized protein n=1 Tax=Psychromicrobium lacuslunae TaxID=1618207 RepID=A0A0D4BYF4_9MICC|nr:hypothetical protein [Psychromicrobium lacuslunae]AJT41121.1 hypothetical protein UM93_05570 [Psychromicrobium lacuslunae]